MSEVKVRWIQRAAGRDPGHVEVVELTDFITGCAANHRLEIVEHIAPPAPLIQAAPVADEDRPLLLDPTPNERRMPRQRRTEE